MPNMKNIISRYNKIKLKANDEENNIGPTCNCRVAQECPLQGKCLSRSIVYKAEVTTERDNMKQYYGSVCGNFKGRYNNHMTSFRHRCYEHQTALSTYIWRLKDRGKIIE